MDYHKLNLIHQDILSEPLEEKEYSEEFVGLFVDGSGNFKFDFCDAAFHSFRRFSKYKYKILVFLSLNTPREEIEKLLRKYDNVILSVCPPLNNLVEYSYWMFNFCFYLVNERFNKILTLQGDGGIISDGWEDYINTNKFDYIGSPWRSDITVMSKFGDMKTTRIANGGINYRTRKKMIEATEFVNKNGGQNNFFKGIKINDKVRLIGPNLFEDAMFSSVLFTHGLAEEPTVEECLKFGHEPIEYSLFLDKGNSGRPLCYHKVDQ